MKLDRYQRRAERTADTRSSPDWRLLISALGLAGEAGEVVDILKKGLGHKRLISEAHLKEELGDVLWYLADIATALGFHLDEVAALNLAKLQRRYPDGFTTSGAAPRLVRLSEAAKNRGVSASTLRRQCAAGKIKAVRLTPRGPWMIEEAE